MSKWTKRELHRLRKDQNTQRIKARINPEINTEHNDQREAERTANTMGKIPTQTFDLLREGQYILKIKNVSEPERGEYLSEATMQVTGTLEVVEALSAGTETMTDGETEARGHTYDEWWSLDPATGAVKQNSKLWQIYEAATGMKLDVDDEIDTDDMVDKTFQAKVVINKPGTRNRTEHDTYGKATKKRREAAKKAEKELEETEESFEDIDMESAPF